MANWIDEILAADTTPLSEYMRQLYEFTSDMAPCHALREVKPIYPYSSGGSKSKSSRKKEKSKKPSLATLNQRLYSNV
ncbi:hypothetical protein P22_1980 [Propionispora sp. 2/2-37]|uniref:hypothetical protein n=1 Tax=Propionispora sp. 2/2-37 TaxID=1677858 RepID=UPI0006BB8378|nr:hypothetical protein [Propionispora sp. 2/2-37]CUH95894.1 hypothetical protein P22_1980 [Propionispora sp. 2/2-37]